jgi:hypothetical protein
MFSTETTQNHHWVLQGTVFTKKTDLKGSRSFASMLSHNTATTLYRVQAIISKSCSSRSRFSLFRHGHPNGWFTTTGRQPSPNPHLAVTALSESPSCQVCLQALSPLKKLSLCAGYIIIEESILQQLSLFAGLADTSLEPATTQAWFSSPIMCSLSYDKKKNTLKSIEANPERPTCY